MHLYIPQAVSSCTPNGTNCWSGIDENSLGCRVSCTGLYADAFYIKDPTKGKLIDKLKENMEEYTGYKNNFARNLKFDPTKNDMSIFPNAQIDNHNLYFSASLESYPQLKFIQIYFETATYDKLEKDKKVNVEAQLGLIGGTMGLLTGFSLLSAVEIVYFAIKFFLSLRVAKTDFGKQEQNR